MHVLLMGETYLHKLGKIKRDIVVAHVHYINLDSKHDLTSSLHNRTGEIRHLCYDLSLCKIWFAKLTNLWYSSSSDQSKND